MRLLSDGPIACMRSCRSLSLAYMLSCPRRRGRREGFVGAAICTGVVGWLLGRWLGRIDWLTSPRNVFLLGHGAGLNVVSPAYGVCGGLYTRVTRRAYDVHDPQPWSTVESGLARSAPSDSQC